MFKLFNKDLKLLIVYRRSILLTFMLPIVLISLFALAFGGIENSSSKSKPIKLLIADIDNTASSRKIITNLDSLKRLKIFSKDIDKAKDLVIKGKYPTVLIFHKGFQDSIEEGNEMPIELMYDEAREMEVGMLQPALTSTIMTSVGRKKVTSNIEKYLNKNFPNMDCIVLELWIICASGH